MFLITCLVLLSMKVGAVGVVFGVVVGVGAGGELVVAMAGVDFGVGATVRSIGLVVVVDVVDVAFVVLVRVVGGLV